MILEKGECVVVENAVQQCHILKILIENDYKFHHGVSLTEAGGNTYGVRYWHRGKYPDCIATLSYEMAQSAMKTGHASNAEDPYVVLTYEEFIARLAGVSATVEVDDLL